MRETSAEVIAWCGNQQVNSTTDWSFRCLGMCGAAWAISPVGGGGAWPNAWDAWTRSNQHPPSESPPPGAPVYWALMSTSPNTGKRMNYGHIAIADDVDGLCWSIDIRRHGKIDRVPINEITSRWGARYVGWTSDLEGVSLPLWAPEPLPPSPPPPPVPTPVPHPPLPIGDDDMPTPCGFIVCNAGTLGHHVDGSPYWCPVDGTVFRVNPGGTIQWVHAGEQEDTAAVLRAGGNRDDTWQGAVGKPDVFGRLIGDKPA